MGSTCRSHLHLPGVARGAMVLHHLLHDPLGKTDEPSTAIATARVSFHPFLCVLQVPLGLALLCLAALRGRCRGADRHVWGDPVSQLP